MKVITDMNYEGIVIHCSASDRLEHDNVKTVDEWHKERGFHEIGYHYVVTKTTGIEVGRAITTQGAHAKGYNDKYIGICLTGKRHFTFGQFEQAAQLCVELMDTFDFTFDKVVAHNFLNFEKSCPNFDVKKEIQSRIKDILLYRGGFDG